VTSASPADLRAIEAECARRGITRVVHFTQSRNLAHILPEPGGIKCTADIRREAADVLNVNDPSRLDQREDYISCTVQYPNYWMLRIMKDREKFFDEWAILLINSSVLWQPSTFFCPRNAAALGGALLATGATAFHGMFADTVTGQGGRTWRRTPKMLAHAPTDDQAEVMVHKYIPRSLITGVAVKSRELAVREQARLSIFAGVPRIPWIVAPELFGVAPSTMVRQGQQPAEEIYAPHTP